MCGKSKKIRFMIKRFLLMNLFNREKISYVCLILWFVDVFCIDDKPFFFIIFVVFFVFDRYFSSLFCFHQKWIVESLFFDKHVFFFNKFLYLFSIFFERSSAQTSYKCDSQTSYTAHTCIYNSLCKI